MKYLLVSWSIRDGENEYDEQTILKTSFPNQSEREIFYAVLKDFYFSEPKRYDDGRLIFEIDGDYRLFELERIEEIEEEAVNALLACGVATILNQDTENREYQVL